MGARYRAGIGFSLPARRVTQPGRIGSLESILGLLKSFKIRDRFLFDRKFGKMVPKTTNIDMVL
jgi:hypothetical protein